MHWNRRHGLRAGCREWAASERTRLRIVDDSFSKARQIIDDDVCETPMSDGPASVSSHPPIDARTFDLPRHDAHTAKRQLSGSPACMRAIAVCAWLA